MRNRLLIAFSIGFGLVALPFIFLKLAFGPISDTVTIDLGREGELICKETYNGDFAQEFYEVEMTLKTPKGKEHALGSALFHDQAWSDRVRAVRLGYWLLIPVEAEEFARIKMVNTNTETVKDTILDLTYLGKDVLYNAKYKSRPVQSVPGSSRIENISGSVIEVIYEYKAEAQYPLEIDVSQKVVYQVNALLGELETKEIMERVLQ